MSDPSGGRRLRLWPGVVIVVLQLLAVYVPGRFASAGEPSAFYAIMGALVVGTLAVWVWWLLFSRARWFDRLGGWALMVGAHALALALADPSARMVAMIPGIPWLCAAFVASLFFRRRLVTVAIVLIASLGWTLVRTDGMSGSMDTDLAWRWSATAEERFLASEASVVLGTSATESRVEEHAAWPGFRGPERDGVVPGVHVATDWSVDPPREIWRRPLGPGWGSFALAGNLLCTQEQRDENETVVCYDATTGEPVWLHAYPARFWEVMGGLGPRATPTFGDGRLYAMGATGVLSCLDAASGEPLWTRDVAADASAPLPDWGFSSSPLLVDDLVVVHAPQAADDRSVVAYDAATGAPRWTGRASGTSYSSPHLATIDDVLQVLMVTSDGLYGFDPASGERLWSHDWSTGGMGDRVLQPALVDGGHGILVGTSFGFGTRRVALARDEDGTWTASEAWTSLALKPYYNDLVVHDGTAFGFDGSIFAAIDVDTGERAWKGGRYGNGQVVLLPDQDLLLIVSESGELVLVRATAERFEEFSRIEALSGKTWNHPIVVDGVVYLRNAKEAAAYRLPR